MTEETQSGNRLKISEHFFSIQGEGATVGCPAVFIRLSMCNFLCSWCDTVDVWKTGNWYDLDEVDKLMDLNGYYTQLRKGAHLIFTGGDPLIQQDAIVNWYKRINEFGRTPERIFIEVETQGYIKPASGLIPIVRQWNVSPKLANSGVEESKRLKYDVLSIYSGCMACFKFPVSTMEDLKEVEEIVRRAGMRRTRVYLMPVCNSRNDFLAEGKKVAEWAKRRGFRFSPRLQLVLWDKTTGV